MIVLGESALRDLASMFIVANTPAYLYRNLREHPAVTRLADEASVEQLVQIVNGTATDSTRLPSAAALHFAALVALLVKDSTDVSHDTPPLALSDWGRRIFAMHRARVPALNRAEIEIDTAVQVSDYGLSFQNEPDNTGLVLDVPGGE